jgi:hypothetical protein
MKKIKTDGIKKAMMPQKLTGVIEKLKENKSKNEKVDLGEFAHKLAVKQLAVDKDEKVEKENKK